MYKKILVALGNATSDTPMLEHVLELAQLTGAETLLLHVADGWAARNFDQLKLAESEEIQADKTYLQKQTNAFLKKDLSAAWMLAMGNPPQEILRVANEQKCDLIVLATHGHKTVGDVIYGSTIEKIRHNTTTALLIIYGGKPGLRSRK